VRSADDRPRPRQAPVRPVPPPALEARRPRLLPVPGLHRCRYFVDRRPHPLAAVPTPRPPPRRLGPAGGRGAGLGHPPRVGGRPLLLVARLRGGRLALAEDAGRLPGRPGGQPAAHPGGRRGGVAAMREREYTDEECERQSRRPRPAKAKLSLPSARPADLLPYTIELEDKVKCSRAPARTPGGARFKPGAGPACLNWQRLPVDPVSRASGAGAKEGARGGRGLSPPRTRPRPPGGLVQIPAAGPRPSPQQVALPPTEKRPENSRKTRGKQGASKPETSGVKDGTDRDLTRFAPV
jgi:hypothetical protein